MYNIIVSLLTNLFRLYITKRFMYIFFENKDVNKKIEFITYIFFYLFTTSTYFIFRYPPFTSVSNIISLYIITLVYSSTHKKKLLIICIIYIINMVCDILSVFLLSDNMFSYEQNTNSAFVTLLLITICEIVAERIIKKRGYDISKVKHWKILIIIPFCSIFVLFIVLINKDSNRTFTVILSIGIMLINTIVFYLYNTIINSYLILEENAVFKQQTEIYSKQLDILMASNNKIRSLQHDMKNHIIQLNILAQKEQAHSIMDYISEMNEFLSNPDEYVHSGNKDIDGILNYMIHNATSKSIKVNTKIKIPENLNIKSFDLNVILGNLLDNAIQALEQEKDKFLNILLLYEKGILYIDIKNNYSGHIMKKNNKLLTTKKDKENHGIGLSNVEKIVNNYNGTIDIFQNQQQFVVEVMLYVPKF